MGPVFDWEKADVDYGSAGLGRGLGLILGPSGAKTGAEAPEPALVPGIEEWGLP